MTTFKALASFEDALQHYGIKRRSGRYPWGSGDEPFQSSGGFLGYVRDLKAKGLTEKEIAEGLGLKSTTELRALNSIAKTEKREADRLFATRLKDKGMANTTIGERMGIPESSVRSLLDPERARRNDILTNTANALRERVDAGDYVDVGAGTELYLGGISPEKKNTAIAMLEKEGYEKFYVKIEQVGTGEFTNTVVLSKPGTTFPEVMANKEKIKPVQAYTDNGGESFKKIVEPVSVDLKRVGVRYAEEGGASKDGVIELRRGVEDLSLGNSRYAQVRIAVDKTHYLKGMAMYSDDLPDGVDIVFNTNKSNTGNKLDAMKALKDDGDLPFGSIVRQREYRDKSGKAKVSPLNVVGDNEEGRWEQWGKTLSSQMLSKQSPALAKQQLDLSFKIKKDAFDEIMSLTNPTVRQKLLEEFADGADSSAKHLKAVGLPRTRNHVILPINSLKDNEVYAPNYRNGEKVVLIRHPHGGTFEIPELIVNNRNREANRLIKGAKDAVGINFKVAQRLSGADFDGDTVLVIPNNSKSIKTTPELAKLKNFDPGMYKLPKDSKIPPMKGKQKHMGDVSNLITDMTIRGASFDEISRAVRHSMVVIDAEKHNLNYRQSAIDHGIADLKKKYQTRGGASTLISLSKSQERLGTRKPRSAAEGGFIDPETGKKMWTYTNETYTKTKVNKKTGEVVTKVLPKTIKSTKMDETDDAFKLSSGTTMEAVYATYANRMKSLANTARKEALTSTPRPYIPSAKKTYAGEVFELNRKLTDAKKNAPLERQAQLLAGSIVSAKRKATPNMEARDLKKIKGQALDEARARIGAKKAVIKITPREWDAIQAGAITGSKLKDILNNADMDVVRQLSMPRERTVMSDAKIRRAKSMLSSGYTQAEIADALGVPTSTLSDAIK